MLQALLKHSKFLSEKVEAQVYQESEMIIAFPMVSILYNKCF